MDHLRTQVPDGAEALVEYFDRTYVNGSLRNIAGSKVVRRIQPAFPPALWNVHNITLADGDRTNNFSEAWNRRFEALIGHKHPSVWTSIELLRADAAESYTAILRHSTGRLEPKRSKKTAKQYNQRLQRLCAEYNDGQRYMASFLRAIAHSIRLVG